MAFKEFKLLSSVWHEEKLLKLEFPYNWDITVVGNKTIPSIDEEKISEIFSKPIGTPRLSKIALKKSQVTIVVDDITRPTPVHQLIPWILQELEEAGIDRNSINLIIAGGTHQSATKEEILKKLGPGVVSTLKVIPHDCKDNLVFLGKSKRGTPLFVNRLVMESDLNIGVGCIYPHPAAGFSGGAKIIVPGVCGIETTRYLHDYLKGAGKRGGSIETEFRKEIEEVADQIGLDFIVNVVLNQERKIAGLFVGDKSLAFKEGVKFATEHYKVPIAGDADIIIADTYPFDINLNFARDRGLWPIYDRKKNVTRVVLADCPLGLGHHELYPTKKSLWSRIYRRLKYVRTKELRNLNSKIQSIQKLIIRKRLDFMILSSGITETELKACFPKAKLYKTWKTLMSDLRLRHKNEIVKVAIFRCAPLFTLE